MQGILVVEGIHHLGFYISRKSGIAVRCTQREFDSVVAGLVGSPHCIVKALGSAMQTVSIVVVWQFVFHAVERELSVFDSVSVTSYDSPEVAVDVQIVGNRVVTEHNVIHFAVLGRCHNRDDAPAEVGYAHFHPVGVGEGIECNRVAIDYCFEVCRIKPRFGEHGLFRLPALTSRQHEQRGGS